ncbi:unnamed protein product [Ambrosiozyma monospora]|uniref:Unnamed protein product n=1 Tax=Ambrosiozyma monospora TaxID=43982 RepID=A0ACB5U3V6_AMBMO|nr:unnamed protein product [Ambrosiozyma monospora]
MGHSTGTQNTTHYMAKYSKEVKDLDPLDFGILQASVSDRDSSTLVLSPDEREQSLSYAKKLIDEGKSNEIMPTEFCEKFFGAPINAYRWFSLMSVKGDDDFFSYDLTAEDHKKTFGKIDKPILLLFSGSDEYVPEYVDKKKLVEGFRQATDEKYWSPLSGIIEGATHNIGPKSEPGAQEKAISLVVEFLKSL